MFSIINRINSRVKGRTRILNPYNNMFVYACQFQLIAVIIHKIAFSVSTRLLFGLSSCIRVPHCLMVHAYIEMYRRL